MAADLLVSFSGSGAFFQAHALYDSIFTELLFYGEHGRLKLSLFLQKGFLLQALPFQLLIVGKQVQLFESFRLFCRGLRRDAGCCDRKPLDTETFVCDPVKQF